METGKDNCDTEPGGVFVWTSGVDVLGLHVPLLMGIPRSETRDHLSSPPIYGGEMLGRLPELYVKYPEESFRPPEVVSGHDPRSSEEGTKQDGVRTRDFWSRVKTKDPLGATLYMIDQFPVWNYWSMDDPCLQRFYPFRIFWKTHFSIYVVQQRLGVQKVKGVGSGQAISNFLYVAWVSSHVPYLKVPKHLI